MIILGIDPGTATTGYGVIEITKKETGRQGKVSSSVKIQKDLKCLGYGLIETSPSDSAAKRLEELNKKLDKLIKVYNPSILAVENIYFFKNLKTAMPISQSKGVILLTAAKRDIPVVEFTPLQVKMAVTGYGRADKKQVQKIVQVLLKLKELPSPDDAADALGIAICCILKQKVRTDSN